jgi:hypothetical protein
MTEPESLFRYPRPCLGSALSMIQDDENWNCRLWSYSSFIQQQSKDWYCTVAGSTVKHAQEGVLRRADLLFSLVASFVQAVLLPQGAVVIILSRPLQSQDKAGRSRGYCGKPKAPMGIWGLTLPFRPIIMLESNPTYQVSVQELHT